MRPKEYIEKVRSRQIYDPVLTFQLSNDFHVRKVMMNYLPNDEESKHCATLLQWDNIYYQPPTTDYVDKKTTVRVGLVQWQMRPYKTLDDVFELLAWNQGIGFFSSEIGPSALFQAYKLIKNGEKQGKSWEDICSALREKFGEKNPEMQVLN